MNDEAEHVALYRKYRPRVFVEITGQDHVISVLKNALRLGRVSHAYLFSGTRGTGKTSVARILAKAYNCEKPKSDGEPCTTCATCKEFASGRALDLVEIDAASNRGIDEIRELRESVRFSPARAKRKVYIIDEVHMLTKEAFNALLKTLEEPPPHAMFVLATTEPEKVPETILSRVQHFEFRRIADEHIQRRLLEIAKAERYELDQEALRLLAFLADGSLRDSETRLGQIMDAFPDGAKGKSVEELFGLPEIGIVHAILSAALEDNPKKVLVELEKLTEKGIDAKVLGRMLVSETHLLLVTLIDPGELARLKKALSGEYAKFFEDHKNVSREAVARLLAQCIEAYQLGYRGPFEILPFELALLEAGLRKNQ